ncbi:pirin family protein [Erwinia sp. HR93]|uniref:pirin family protein n=1 Tax=Erwinia sp. HR93 TaxID=3094840 RepID=UPI002ADEF5F8|nr:pirin family protein [Erwinia sp. HR93]MEA1065251.1 pirin family protein [Erwinia sp. HR93]
MKKILGLYDAPRAHWVGNGFPVRSLFSYHNQGKQLSPFLLLDYAGPAQFEPAQTPRGVGQHPHRGFETVTIVYKGEVAHRDSTGRGGVIGPGDVQWMTAGAGILHEEFHSPAFTQTGGELEMIQLWVNLPAKNKLAPPNYQSITNGDIPDILLPDAAGKIRIIAGTCEGHSGPAHTYTPMNIWDIRLAQGGKTTFTLPQGWTTALVVVKGTLLLNEETVIRESQLAILDNSAEALSLEANNEAIVLLLNGEPIDEPIVGHGPFVMNSQREIEQAIDDVTQGRFGIMPV